MSNDTVPLLHKIEFILSVYAGPGILLRCYSHLPGFHLLPGGKFTINLNLMLKTLSNFCGKCVLNINFRRCQEMSQSLFLNKKCYLQRPGQHPGPSFLFYKTNKYFSSNLIPKSLREQQFFEAGYLQIQSQNKRLLFLPEKLR